MMHGYAAFKSARERWALCAWVINHLADFYNYLIMSEILNWVLIAHAVVLTWIYMREFSLPRAVYYTLIILMLTKNQQLLAVSKTTSCSWKITAETLDYLYLPDKLHWRKINLFLFYSTILFRPLYPGNGSKILIKINDWIDFVCFVYLIIE